MKIRRRRGRDCWKGDRIRFFIIIFFSKLQKCSTPPTTVVYAANVDNVLIIEARVRN